MMQNPNQIKPDDLAEKHRLFLENTNDIIWIMDNNLHMTYMSPSVERHSGTPYRK